MARKSRRTKSTEVNISQDIVKNKNLLDTAAYVRLSVENGGNETDETLVVQQMLVEKYIEEHPDLRLAGTYSDNGLCENRKNPMHCCKRLVTLWQGLSGNRILSGNHFTKIKCKVYCNH